MACLRNEGHSIFNTLATEIEGILLKFKKSCLCILLVYSSLLKVWMYFFNAPISESFVFVPTLSKSKGCFNLLWSS